jgi:hypothetical protein
MSKHFAYLTQHNEADFFQKVANEQAETRLPKASSSIVKTAMQNLLEGVTFEKVAARLDRDILILKTAGESGMNLGMQKRASAYIDQLLEQCEMTPEEFDGIFEKVSGEAIMGDLVVAQAHLSQDLDDDGLAWLNGELTKIGAELTELAVMEKEAFFRALRAMGGGIGKLLGRGAEGIGMGAKAVARLPGRAIEGIRDYRITRGIEGLKNTEKALDKVRNVERGLQAAGKSKSLNATYQAGKAESLAAQAKAQKGKVDKLIAKQHAARGVTMDTPKPPPIPAAAKMPKAPKASPKVEATKVEAPKASTKVEAPSAAKPAEAPAPKAGEGQAEPPPKTPAASAADDAQFNATKGGVTLKGAYEKVRDKGWKALEPAEKQKLINAGLATVVGGRVILGHGILTGGEGII